VFHYWLSYRRRGKPIGVVVIEAPDPLQARFRAAVEGLDREGDFADSYGLDPETAARIPADMMGRMLTPAEAYKLIRVLERAAPIPKRPPAPSVRRGKGRRAPNKRAMTPPR
jgi:hypothetical protein